MQFHILDITKHFSMTNILLSYPHIIALVMWIIIALVAVARYFKVSVFARASWGWLIAFTIAFHFGYAGLLTWGQYHVWAAPGNDFGKSLLSSPLPTETPLPVLLEWVRPYLARPLGYFAFDVFMRFFLNIVILLCLAGLFALLLKLRARYRPINFAESDISAIVLAVLVSGWPGVIVLIPLGFLCAILISIGMRVFRGVERIYLPPAFLLVAPIAITWGIPILNYFHLYSLLKI